MEPASDVVAGVGLAVVRAHLPLLGTVGLQGAGAGRAAARKVVRPPVLPALRLLEAGDAAAVGGAQRGAFLGAAVVARLAVVGPAGEGSASAGLVLGRL